MEDDTKVRSRIASIHEGNNGTDVATFRGRKIENPRFDLTH